MKVFLYILLILFSFAPNAQAGSYVDKRTGVEIIWDEEELEEQEINGLELTRVKRNNKRKFLKILKKELKKYPENALKGHLEKIYMVKYIAKNGHRIGGQAQNMAETIYISRGNENSIKSTFHHEVAHILYYSHNFPYKNEWLALNPEDFKYIGSGFKAISENRVRQKTGKKILKSGFISSYAQSALEEDFAEMAEFAIINKRSMRKKVRKYNGLEDKFELLKKFYISIDPKMKDLF